MGTLWIAGLIYIFVGIVVYVGLQAAPTPRSVLADLFMALVWPLTLVALVVWSFVGDEEEGL